MKKILSIGEATLDSFLFLRDANIRCTINKQKCEFCMNYADKVMADDLVFSVGGNAANTAVAFARLGFDSKLFSVVGDDWTGQKIRSDLEREKIDLRYVQVEPGPSSYATALVFQGERNLVIYHVPRDYQLPDFEPADWLYLTSMGRAFMEAYDKVLHWVDRTGAKVSFNPGTYQLKAGVEKLRPFFKITTALFVNVEEARHLTELPGSASLRQLSEALYDLGPEIVNITDGPNGAYAFDGKELSFCPIFPAEVKERTGAGDAYASGFTAALLSDLPLGEAMRWGMANSSSVIQKVGPQQGLLNSVELASLLEANQQIRPEISSH